MTSLSHIRKDTKMQYLQTVEIASLTKSLTMRCRLFPTPNFVCSHGRSVPLRSDSISSKTPSSKSNVQDIYGHYMSLYYFLHRRHHGNDISIPLRYSSAIRSRFRSTPMRIISLLNLEKGKGERGTYRQIRVIISNTMILNILRRRIARRVTSNDLLPSLLIYSHIVNMHDSREDEITHQDFRPGTAHPQIQDHGHRFLGDFSGCYIPVWSDGSAVHDERRVFAYEPGDFAR